MNFDDIKQARDSATPSYLVDHCLPHTTPWINLRNQVISQAFEEISANISRYVRNSLWRAER
jgi:hypothetical protein